MIAHVRGTVAALTLNAAVIDVGGLGHHVFCTPGTIAGLRHGQECQLATSLVVREDSLTLYGFADVEERDMFELVQTASGVGPKVAQAMLAVLPPDRLRHAIATEDHAALTAVPGIGRKGAERIVVELKDRVGPASTSSAPAASAAAWREQVTEALQGLGWSAKDALKAVDTVEESGEVGSPPDVAILLRAALRTLSKT
ncbi:Holliday junction branch migration protein RuvA [Aeromicrobium sp. CF4.19]|uniref:Holliday junction branch migration protein RuvA n=1 Tax=Aeromicrobium sp. CF4.19 TaxID=3373082 RepID=UPI003EE81EF8